MIPPITFVRHYNVDIGMISIVVALLLLIPSSYAADIIYSQNNYTTTNTTTIDYHACYNDLFASDINLDGYIRYSEYLPFLQRYSQRICHSIPITTLSLQQSATYTTLSCLCRQINMTTGVKYDNNTKGDHDPDCCYGENSKIVTTFVYDTTTKQPIYVPPHNLTMDQKAYYKSICKLSDATINRNMDNNDTSCLLGSSPSNSPMVGSDDINNNVPTPIVPPSTSSDAPYTYYSEAPYGYYNPTTTSEAPYTYYSESPYYSPVISETPYSYPSYEPLPSDIPHQYPSYEPLPSDVPHQYPSYEPLPSYVPSSYATLLTTDTPQVPVISDAPYGYPTTTSETPYSYYSEAPYGYYNPTTTSEAPYTYYSEAPYGYYNPTTTSETPYSYYSEAPYGYPTTTSETPYSYYSEAPYGYYNPTTTSETPYSYYSEAPYGYYNPTTTSEAPYTYYSEAPYGYYNPTTTSEAPFTYYSESPYFSPVTSETPYSYPSYEPLPSDVPHQYPSYEPLPSFLPSSHASTGGPREPTSPPSNEPSQAPSNVDIIETKNPTIGQPIPKFDNCQQELYYSKIGATSSEWTIQQVRQLIVDTHRLVLPRRATRGKNSTLTKEEKRMNNRGNNTSTSTKDSIISALRDLDSGSTKGTVHLYMQNIDVQVLTNKSRTFKRGDLWPMDRGMSDGFKFRNPIRDTRFDTNNGSLSKPITRNHAVQTDVHTKRPSTWNVDKQLGKLAWGECDMFVGDNRSNCTVPAMPPSETSIDTARNERIKTPPTNMRGPIARSLLYAVIRYGEELNFQLSDCPPFRKNIYGYKSILLQWHQDYPVTATEQERNYRACANWQGNRNPFVDYPELVEQFFGKPDTILNGKQYSKCMNSTNLIEDETKLFMKDIFDIIFRRRNQTKEKDDDSNNKRENRLGGTTSESTNKESKTVDSEEHKEQSAKSSDHSDKTVVLVSYIKNLWDRM